YQAPEHAELVINTDEVNVEAAVDMVIKTLAKD
ncbi:MAG: adenylyl-sulfate kinase, partial [Balneolaceae bacterium]